MPGHIVILPLQEIYLRFPPCGNLRPREELLFERGDLFKQRHGLGSRLRHQDVHIGNGAQNEVVGVEIVSLSMIFDGIRRIFRSRYAMVFVLFPSSMLPGKFSDSADNKSV